MDGFHHLWLQTMRETKWTGIKANAWLWILLPWPCRGTSWQTSALSAHGSGGLALIVAAIALPRIIHFVRWAWTLKLIGIIFIAVAATIFIVAYWRYGAESKKLMRPGMVMTPARLVKILTILLMVTSIISVALLFHE